MNETASRAGAAEGQGPKALIGSVISDRYRLDEVIGEGGMGAVYLAEHLLIRKRVAVKVLHAEMTRLPEVVARFEREAMAAAHIDHANVAAATDFGKLENGSFFLVLEYVEGRGLREEMAAGPFPVGRAAHVAGQILRALHRAHALGIVHRDLKPENVMLVERDGDPDFVKVLDFGIAKVPVGELAPVGRGSVPDGARAALGSGPALTQLGMVYGTPEYMAPEQALGQEVDHRADLYALGVILFEMLAGRRPFDAANKVQILGMVVSKPVPTIASVAPRAAVPAAVEEVVRTLLAKVASERFADARAAVEALERALSGGPAASAAPAPAAGSSVAPPAGASGQAPGGFGRAAGPLLSWARKLPEALRRGGPLERPPLSRRAAAAGVAGVLAGALTLGLGVRAWRARPPSPPLALSAPLANPSAPEQMIATPAPSDAIAPAPDAAPSDDEVRAASGEGLDALARLAERSPHDRRVRRALARARVAAKQWARAVATYDALLAADPSALDEPDVRKDLVALAQAGESADATFDLLETKAGAGGADLLYELATERQVAPAVSRRALAAVSQGRARENASPALRTALGLRGAQPCDRRKHFAAAKQYGDARSLPYLAPLQATTGCGFLKRQDCYRCVRGDNGLYEAVRAIQARRRGDAGGAHEP